MNMRYSIIACALAAVAAPASAVTLVNGNNVLTGTTVAAEPQLAGTIVEDEVSAFSFAAGNGILSGSVQSRVILADDGTYDFSWRITDTAYTGTDGERVRSLRLGGFGPTLVGSNANYRTDGLGSDGPDVAKVFAALGAVNFIFDEGLANGAESYFFFIDTAATRYFKTGAYDIAGTQKFSDSYATFAPGVPEPATWAMMIGGFGFVGAASRRRRATTVTFA
jgi:hypothetical protein